MAGWGGGGGGGLGVIFAILLLRYQPFRVIKI